MGSQTGTVRGKEKDGTGAGTGTGMGMGWARAQAGNFLLRRDSDLNHQEDKDDDMANDEDPVLSGNAVEEECDETGVDIAEAINILGQVRPWLPPPASLLLYNLILLLLFLLVSRCPERMLQKTSVRKSWLPGLPHPCWSKSENLLLLLADLDPEAGDGRMARRSRSPSRNPCTPLQEGILPLLFPGDYPRCLPLPILYPASLVLCRLLYCLRRNERSTIFDYRLSKTNTLGFILS